VGSDLAAKPQAKKKTQKKPWSRYGPKKGALIGITAEKDYF
jgi:hypothetical protein